jgi:hypothetical protein
MSPVVKMCGWSGCHRLALRGQRYCPQHRRQKNQTYGRRHRDGRLAVFEQAGWRCHYCGAPVTSADDIAHLDETQRLALHQAPHALRVPAHRACHNAHAPHLIAS